jgi:SnoaL-like domain
MNQNDHALVSAGGYWMMPWRISNWLRLARQNGRSGSQIYQKSSQPTERAALPLARRAKSDIDKLFKEKAMPSSYEDHSSLHELYCALFRNLDDRKLDAMAEQYHPQVTVRQFPSRAAREAGAAMFVATGCNEIIARMKARFTRHDATHHMMGNFVTDVAGDEASVKALLRAYHRGKGEGAGLFEESLARFESKAYRTPDGVWKIMELDYTVLIPLGSPKVFGESFSEVTA